MRKRYVILIFVMGIVIAMMAVYIIKPNDQSNNFTEENTVDPFAPSEDQTESSDESPYYDNEEEPYEEPREETNFKSDATVYGDASRFIVEELEARGHTGAFISKIDFVNITEMSSSYYIVTGSAYNGNETGIGTFEIKLSYDDAANWIDYEWRID